MIPPSESRDASTLAPDDAFTLLGNETRIAILRALWEAYEPYEDGNAVRFSTLYDRVGANDSGNFNYHLGKLTGHFVRRVEDGYTLAAPGFEVVRALVAGGATETATLDPSEVDATCPRCASALAASYEDGTMWLRCTGCVGYWPRRDGTVFGFGLPPAGLRDRDPDEVFAATVAYSVRRFETMVDGVCPECGGPTDASLSVCADHDASDGICDECDVAFCGVVRLECSACRFAWRSPSYAPALSHPAVVAFYHDHGVDHNPASWPAIRRGLEWREELDSLDPPRVRLHLDRDGDELAMTVDSNAVAVVAADR